MRNTIIIFILIHFIFCQTTYSQHDTIFNKEIAFANYLLSKEKFNEAVFVLNKIDTTAYRIDWQRDTLNYLKGWLHYCQKNLDTSSLVFSKVTPSSSMYYKSKFFSAYNYSFLNQLNLSNNILNKLNTTDSSLIELKYFMLAGNSLLNRDLDTFKLFSKYFTYQFFAISNEENTLISYSSQLSDYKPKSMLLAGVLSSVVPGAGKIYAGKVGEGISSFLLIGTIAGIAAENYYKSGISNFKTIFFGSVFSIFYVGNIYGSVFSVKLVNQQWNENIDHRILFDLHIPLRTIFN